MRWKPLVLILFLAGLSTALVIVKPSHFFSLVYLKTQYEALMTFRLAHPLLAMALYFTLHVLVTSLSLPGLIMMSLAGGATFGLLWGTVLASFASAIGSTLAFLIARFALRDAVQRRLGERLHLIHDGMAASGHFYLFGLRLLPVVPYSLVNLLMGMTCISTPTFYWISQAGMLPLTVIYVNAGTQLAQLNTLRDILSPSLLASLLLVMLAPWLARWLIKSAPARFRRGAARQTDLSQERSSSG